MGASRAARIARHHARVRLSASRQQDGKLVAAQARHRVHLARHPPQPRRYLRQQLVAPRVAKGVVDVLKAVEVQQQQRQRAGGKRRAEPLVEQRAIGQAGERVVRRLVAQRLLHLPVLGGVQHDPDDTPRAARLVARPFDLLADVAHLAVRAHNAVIDVQRARLPGHDGGHPGPDALSVLGVDQVGEPLMRRFLSGCESVDATQFVRPMRRAIGVTPPVAQVGAAPRPDWPRYRAAPPPRARALSRPWTRRRSLRRGRWRRVGASSASRRPRPPRGCGR